MECISCQTEVDVGTRICRTCGSPISVDPKLEDLYFSRLSASAPPLFVQKVRSAPYLAKEHRTVTAVMFSIANVQAFEESVPEDARAQLLNQALDRFARLIFQYEGTIAKLWENTVLAFFGAPITHEDDPLRAVHAGLSILSEVQEISKQSESAYGVPLRLKIGINSGPIVIGDIKSNLKFDFHSLDETLECLDIVTHSDIPACEIILLENTYRFIKPFVDCEKLNDLVCEELDTVLHLWRLDQIANQTNNFQRSPINLNTSLVGREKEIDQLLELTETVLAGLGRVGIVTGDPGIGKSRLILEWQHQIRVRHPSSQIHWIQAQGLAFGRELAYHLLKDLMRKALGAPEGAESQAIKDLLIADLQEMQGVDNEMLYQYIAHLLEIPLTDLQEDQIHHLNATELRAQYLFAVRTFLQHLAFEHPLLIILEDLHWADASSVDLLTDLLPMTATYPILFCLVTRPDHESTGWRLVTRARDKIGSRLTRIDLGSLSEPESETLLKQLVPVTEMPETIRSIVIGKSEGNPYFVEELVRMLINEGFIVHNNERWSVINEIDINKIPDSLQGLLTARIDRLPPEARLTLRVASVIGRTIPERVIESVMAEHAPKTELMEQLSTLESMGMLKVDQVHPELSYKFQHIMLHDAAYHAILEDDLRMLHLSVGKALEHFYPEQKERLASQLAQHFLKGKDTEKAFFYFDLAGHVAMDAYAHVEAESFFNQAIRLTFDTEKLAHLYTDLGESLAQQSKHREAIQAWKNAIYHHRELNNFDKLARVYAWSARSAWWGYDPKRSLEICLEGLRAVEGAIESPDIAYLVHETGRAYLFNYQPEKARAFSEQALEMAKRLDAFDVQAETLATIGILPTLKPEQAIAALEMAVEISETHNLYGSASRAYINLSAVIDNLGDIRLARDYQKRAIQLGNKAGGIADELLIQQSIANASLWLADFEDARIQIEQMRQISRENDAYLAENTLNLLYLESMLARFMGNFSQAIETLTDLIDRSRQIGDYEHVLQSNRALAEVIIESFLLEENKSNSPNVDIALSMITDAIRGASESAIMIGVPLQCLLSNIYAIKGDFSKAEEAVEKANAIYLSQPVMQDRVKIMLAQARLAAAKGEFDHALTYLTESLQMLEKMEGRWWRARIWLEMANLYLKRNEPEDVDQAHNLYRDALAEFKDMNVGYYPDIIIEKLRLVKNITRAQAIAHKKITLELAEAGRVQNTFIPTHSPQVEGYDISGVLLPAHETSGDFFDFIDLDKGKLGVVIADVGDKGAGAALYMAMSRTLIRTYAGEEKMDPQKVIHHVNRRILVDTPRGIFLTIVFGILDPVQHTFTYVNAGHNPPYLIKNTNERLQLIPLKKTGSLVGIFNENTWEVESITLSQGDSLVLFTDGITEAQNEAGDFYGNDRLTDSLKTNFTPEAETFRNGILEDVQDFVGAAPRLDDITLVVISRNQDNL